MTPKMLQLVQMLKSETERGRLTWDEVDDEAFRTRVGTGLVRVAKGTRRYEQEGGEILLVPAIDLVVTGPTARIVEDGSFPEGDAGHAAAESLFRCVRRAALQSDVILDSMMLSLQPSAK